ncbi:MAG: hypothetical protein RLZZ292_1905 [Bacteroidota bacterium]|jgi:ligand-binding sensor domain-containing protein
MKSFIVFLFSYLLLSQSLLAQSDLKLGEWKSFLPYQRTRSVTQSTEKVFWATDYSIAILDKEERSFQFKSKVEGLSDAGIQLVKYNTFSEVLMIVYSNSNIDLMYKDGTIQNVKDIENNIDIIGDKAIYDVFVVSADEAYLACGFGVVKMNMRKGEFEYTTYTNIKVNAVTVFDDVIYAATDKGIYSVSNSKNLNLADFNNWKLLNNTQGFPNTYSTKVLRNFKQNLYLDIDQILYRYDKSALTQVWKNQDKTIKYLTAEGEHLLLGIDCINPNACNGEIIYFNADGTQEKISQADCINNPVYGIEDSKGRVWLADKERKLRMLEKLGGACKTFETNSPYSENVGEITIDSNRVWVASGGIDQTGNYLRRPDGLFRYEDRKWDFFNGTNVPAMSWGDYFLNTTRVAIHPKTKKVFAASMWGGLLSYNPTTKEALVFDKNNTPELAAPSGDPLRTRLTGLAFDKKDVLWISNNLSDKCISAMDTKGKFYSFAVGQALPIYQVMVDQNNYKWFAIGQGDGGILVFDEGKNLTDKSDDRYAFINKNNSKLPSNRVFCMEKDLDGQVWVGTDKGVGLFNCSGDKIFKNECVGATPRVTVDGLAAYLLASESVQSIAVDGANRKWFGTTSGIFVQSSDGTRQEAFFNTDNSPLFDNNVIDIAINQSNGEVWVATNKGIQVIQGEAIAGRSINEPTVVAYPNPVRPDYTGLIAIKGVAQDADIKITDSNGRLVYATKALGGQAVWDGNDYNGTRVSTGVYLVFSTGTADEEAAESGMVAKILFVH